MKIPSYRVAACLYISLFSLLTFSYWGNGGVVAPDRQHNQVSLKDDSGSTLIENYKFSDFTKKFVPEINEHLKAKKSGYLALWTNHNELGRPPEHLGGFGSAYLPSWILANLTDSPWIFITTISLLTSFLAGIFLLLFCKEQNLSPLAGFMASSSIGTSPFFMYWLTFPMFISVWCWGLGALYGLVRIDKKRDLFGWSILGFSVYSFLMTARPQGAVYVAYTLFFYWIYITHKNLKYDKRAARKYVVMCISAVFCGSNSCTTSIFRFSTRRERVSAIGSRLFVL